MSGSAPRRKARRARFAVALAAALGTSVFGAHTALAAVVPSGLLPNGSFESSLSGWAGSHATLSLASDGADGGNALNVSYNDTTPGFSAYTAPRPVRPTFAGKSLHASALLRTDTGARRFCLVIREFDSGGAVLGSHASCTTGTKSWQQLTVDYTTVASGGSLDVYVNESMGAQPGDSFEIDSAQLIVDTPSGLLPNGSFESSPFGWAGSHSVLSTAPDGVDGGGALKVTYNDTTAGFSAYTSPRPIQGTFAGNNLHASAFIRTDVRTRRFCLTIREFDGGGAVVGFQSSCLYGMPSWQEIAVSYTTLQSGGSVDVYVNEAYGAQPGDTFEVDGAQLNSLDDVGF